MAFDIQGAKKAGYSDTEIQSYLNSKTKSAGGGIVQGGSDFLRTMGLGILPNLAANVTDIVKSIPSGHRPAVQGYSNPFRSQEQYQQQYGNGIQSALGQSGKDTLGLASWAIPVTKGPLALKALGSGVAGGLYQAGQDNNKPENIATTAAISAILGPAIGKLLTGLAKGVLVPAFGRGGGTIINQGLKGKSSSEISDAAAKKVEELSKELNKMLKGKSGMTRAQFMKEVDKLASAEKSGLAGKSQTEKYRGNVVSELENFMKNLGGDQPITNTYPKGVTPPPLNRPIEYGGSVPRATQVGGNQMGMADEQQIPLLIEQLLKQGAAADSKWSGAEQIGKQRMAKQLVGILKGDIEQKSGNPKGIKNMNKQMAGLLNLLEGISKRGDFGPTTNPSNIGRAFGIPLGSLSVGMALGNPALSALLLGGTTALENPEIALLLSKLLNSSMTKQTGTVGSRVLPNMLQGQ